MTKGSPWVQGAWRPWRFAVGSQRPHTTAVQAKLRFELVQGHGHGEVAVASCLRQDRGCVQGSGLAAMVRQKEVLDWQGCVRDCLSGSIIEGGFVVVLFMCAASIKLWRIVRGHSLAHQTTK
jgi:hypothetical protein